MKHQLVELERIHFSRAFPWVYLFRAFRLALDIRKMILGAMALLLLAFALNAFSYFPLDFSEPDAVTLRQAPWESAPLVERERIELTNLGELLLQPVLSVWRPGFEMLSSPVSWTQAAQKWTQILLAIGVWSLFGTAISRMVAVQFAVDQRVNLKESLKFAVSKWLWAVSALLMPLAGLLGLWFGCLICGWIGQIPAAGPVILSVIWFFPLLFAFASLLLLIGMLLGWPLMIATLSTQGSDAFDGFSRSFDYVYSRFWHLLWFSIVALVHGVLVLAIVLGAIHAIEHLAVTFSSVDLTSENASAVLQQGVSVWHHVLFLLASGFAASYFWTAGTIIYFLLRQSEDAAHLSEVYLPQDDSSDDLVQLAGVAASDQPVIERPPKHEPESRQPGSETDIHD